MAIKIFVRCWLIYWLLILIAPFRAEVESPWIGIAIQFVFFISVIAGYFAIPASFPARKIEQVLPKPDSFYLRLFWLSIALSILGSVFLTFDRVIIQGISFSDGLAVAREKWREAGEERGGGISSIYSVLGYLFAPAFYYSIINLAVYKNPHRRKAKLKWLIIILLIGWNSILTGGRSVAFVAFIMYIASQAYYHQFFINADLTKWKHRLRPRTLIVKKSVLLRNILIAGLVGYSLYIFAARSEANSMSVVPYVNHALDPLGLEIYPFLAENASNVPFSNVLYLFTLFLGYLLHSYVVTTKIFLYPYDNDSLVIFTGLGLILAKIGLIRQPDTDWFLAGSFPSLPGSLYLQGGFALMIIFGILLGFGARFISVCIYKYRFNSMLLFIYVIFLSVIITSPVLFIFDSLMFPFILVQFVFFSMLSKYRIRLNVKTKQIT